MLEIDDRKPYGETRYIAYGPIGRRLYCPVFTIRGNTLRVISLRKANSREVRDYEQET
ncbi:BrnT family toxin [Cupriavidus necator]|uniref:BrnT family toxin n=1 Tax=Cupriavidus TaxID=106589 RepID=UPI002ED7AE43